MDLSILLNLLDRPEQLAKEVATLRMESNLSEELEGFIVLYDQCEGDSTLIREILKENELHFQQKVKTTKSRKLYFWSAAAAILAFVLSIFGYIYLNKTTSEVQQLSGIYKDPGLPNFMGTSKKTKLEDVMFLYKSEKYQLAIEQLKKLKSIQNENDTLTYYSGVLSYELKNYKEAKRHFNALIRSKFRDQALYYEGLIAFRQGDIKKAKKIFSNLIKSENIDVQLAVINHLKQLSGSSKN